MKKMIINEKPKKTNNLGRIMRLQRRANEREINEILEKVETVKDC